jgi:hypothetical protein
VHFVRCDGCHETDEVHAGGLRGRKVRYNIVSCMNESSIIVFPAGLWRLVGDYKTADLCNNLIRNIEAERFWVKISHVVIARWYVLGNSNWG